MDLQFMGTQTPLLSFDSFFTQLKVLLVQLDTYKLSARIHTRDTRRTRTHGTVHSLVRLIWRKKGRELVSLSYFLSRLKKG